MPPKGQAKPAHPTSEGGLTDDLIEALQDVRVVEALGRALSPLISLSIEEGLKKHLEGLTTAVRELKSDNVRLKGQIEVVSKENTRLSKSIEDQGRRLDELESYSRSDNLIIRGLAERSAAEISTGAPALDDASGSTLRDSHGSVEETVMAFCSEALGVKVLQQDISTAHRLKAGPKDKIRPIIVRFTNRRVRDVVYHAKKQLKNSREHIYISEHLTKNNSDLFFESRKLLKDKKIFGTWTQGDQVYVRFSPDPAVRATLIKKSTDLNLRP